VKIHRRFLAPALCVTALLVQAQEKQDRHASEAAQALAAVDEILQQVSHLTGLPVKRKVQGEVVSREQIRSYIAQQLKETTSSEQLHAQEVACIKFGLLPAGFKLEKFLLDLLAEQATAFYDPKTKKIYLSDWTPLDAEKPAIAHELTHALQDQHTDLQKYMDNKTMSQDEEAARQAVVEGEGVLAMMDYTLAPMGRRAVDLPNLAEMMESVTKSGLVEFPIFSAAPAYLKEGLLFPYTSGMVYAQAKSKTYGAEVYAALLDHPPHSTHEIMHPDAPAVPVVELQAPEIPAAARTGYKKLDSNVLGEFDISVLLKETLTAEAAKTIAPAWRGFHYDVYENAAGQVLLAHRSQWKDAASAQAFGEAYRRVIAKKAFPGEDNRVEVHGETVDVIEGLIRR